jgi:hypothetical protein
MLYEEWCATGQLSPGAVPIFEFDLDLSTVLHAIGDISAAVADVVVPGSGMVIDVINMLSYFVEASFKNAKTQLNDIIKLSLSGLIQFVAIFDPLNIVTTLKTGLNQIFTALRGGASPTTIAAARLAARSVGDGIIALKNSALRVIGNVITTLSQSRFGQVISWLSGRLGITDVLGWLRRFITQTLPGYIKTFLELLARLNPSGAGSQPLSGELAELITKAGGKGLVTVFATDAAVNQSAQVIHNTVKQTAATFNSFYSSNTGSNFGSYLKMPIHNTDFSRSAQDATAVKQPVRMLPKGAVGVSAANKAALAKALGHGS